MGTDSSCTIAGVTVRNVAMRDEDSDSVRDSSFAEPLSSDIGQKKNLLFFISKEQEDPSSGGRI
ncbi:Hypothetical protein CUL131002_0611c [Corynebacterium ulcerans]|nr:Hypothetical protein CUL131002_0611c [Corynebacterium ulcerans]